MTASLCVIISRLACIASTPSPASCRSPLGAITVWIPAARRRHRRWRHELPTAAVARYPPGRPPRRGMVLRLWQPAAPPAAGLPAGAAAVPPLATGARLLAAAATATTPRPLHGAAQSLAQADGAAT